MKLVRTITTTICACHVLFTTASAQNPVVNELRNEAGAAYAQDVLDQANARAAASQQAEANAADRAYAPMEQRLRNSSPGFNLYADWRFTQNPGERRWMSGSRNWDTRPWNASERIKLLGQFQNDYNNLPTGDRAGWEAKATPAVHDRPAEQAISGGWLSAKVSGQARSATPAESQQAAIKKYPALAKSGSPLNKEFVARVSMYRTSVPQRFSDPDWPMALADESVQALAAGLGVAK